MNRRAFLLAGAAAAVAPAIPAPARDLTAFLEPLKDAPLIGAWDLASGPDVTAVVGYSMVDGFAGQPIPILMHGTIRLASGKLLHLDPANPFIPAEFLEFTRA